MLPNKNIQPSDETEHIAIIIDLGQTILSMTLQLIPDIPLVECDLDRSGRKTEIDPIDLGKVDE